MNQNINNKTRRQICGGVSSCEYCHELTLATPEKINIPETEIDIDDISESDVIQSEQKYAGIMAQFEVVSNQEQFRGFWVVLYPDDPDKCDKFQTYKEAREFASALNQPYFLGQCGVEHKGVIECLENRM